MATITGAVYDSIIIVGLPVPNATVVVYNMAGKIVLFSYTSATGEYSFTNLTAGAQYRIVAAKDGYHTSNVTTFMAPTILPSTINIAIDPNADEDLNTIYGIVKDGSSASIEGATAILSNSTTGDIYTVTNTITDGEYAIYNIPSGNYKLNVGKPGYVSTSSIPISLNTAQIQNADMVLNSISTGIISGVITNSLNNPVSNAFVGVYTTNELLIKYTFTNLDGKYIFGNMQAGSYVIKSKLSE